MHPRLHRRRPAVGVPFAVVGLLAAAGLTACGGGDTPNPGPTTPLPAVTAVDPALNGLVGPGCAAYVHEHRSGRASIAGMAADPLAAMVNKNPLLTELSRAISGNLNKKVRLGDTLDGGEFTVFAPVDPAFAKLSSARRAVLKAESRELVKVLTYHVVTGRLDPGQVVGVQKSVEGGNLKVTNTKGRMKVDGAHVICGGIRTANATVYLIDKVLTPSE